MGRLSSEALIPIQRALAERRVLTLEYRGGERRDVTRRQVEPLGLVYYSDNWHLIGYCRLRRDVRDFRTDRILKLQPQNELFAGHADFSLKRYLECETRDGEFEMVRVRFPVESMERVRREWFWGLVEEKAEPEGVVVTLVASSFDWIASWILSFGSTAEVLAPERLKELVAAEAAKVAAKYSPVRLLPPADPPEAISRLRSSVRRLPEAETRGTERARMP